MKSGAGGVTVNTSTFRVAKYNLLTLYSPSTILRFTLSIIAIIASWTNIQWH